MTIRIAPDGTVEFIYADRLRPLLQIGHSSIRRASHVEPMDDGRWQADLSPIDGPMLSPTFTRAESLRCESEWIEEHYLNVGRQQGQLNASSNSIRSIEQENPYGRREKTQ